MYQSYPLATVPAQDRFDYFQSLVDELFCPMQCDLHDGTPADFRASIETTRLGKLQLAQVATSPILVRKRTREIGRIHEAPYLIKFQLQGDAFWSQCGRDVHLRPGDFVICSTAEPYMLRFDGPYKMPVLAVSEPTMRCLTPDPDQFLGRRMPGDDASCGLLSSFVAQVVSKMSQLPDPMAERVETNILDLLGGVLSAHAQSHCNRGVARERQIENIKRFVHENLRNRRLGPAMVARALGVSTRYIHRLFAAESETLTRYIRSMRLAACHRSLTDAAFAHLSITEIALYWGFYDLSHMTRGFRRLYDTTPREFRASAALPHNA